MTIAQARTLAKENGYTLRKKDGEYRINEIGGDEATAYYTDDIEDATGTILAIVDGISDASEKQYSPDTVAITQESNYGQTVYYPASDLAQLFANIANTKTLTSHALAAIEAHGFKVEIERPTTKTWR